MENNNNFLSTIGAAIEGKTGGIVINFVLIPILVLAALLLPPINLGSRIASVGYDNFEQSTGGTVSDPDGTRVDVLPEGLDGDIGLKLIPVPRDAFLRGDTDEDLVTAAEQFPPNLVMKSPFYQIKHKGADPTAVMLYVPIPNESEPYTTLDVYSWNGNAWEWLPSQQIAGEETLELKLDYLPESMVVVQTHPVRPYFSTNLSAGNEIPASVQETLVELNPQGLYLDADGRVVGEVATPAAVPENAPYITVPTIRNWEDGGVVRSDLIDNMLIDPAARQQQIQILTDLVVGRNYAGIDLDYRGIAPDLKPDYSSFIEELRDAMPANKRLSVHVELPHQISVDTWDTGAYDWRALGAAADVVKIPTPVDPRAYIPNGEMDNMLSWAVGEVNRYKIQLLLSTKSLEDINGVYREISYNDALSPFGNVNIASGSSTVIPGQEVIFNLIGLQGSTGIQYDANSGSYWYAYIDNSGQQRTVFIEDAASISKKLTYVVKYNLGGVAVQNLLTESNDSQIWNVVSEFLNLVIPQVESNFAVVWRVDNAEQGGTILESNASLAEPNFSWTAPENETGGVYEISALISGDGGNSGSLRGSVQIVVASPTPTPSPTPVPPTPTPVPPTPTPEPTATPKPAPQPASQPASSSSPAAATNTNQPFDYGIQVDPMNVPGNVSPVANMGFRWVKFQMPWKDVEPNPGSYSWGGWDGRIDAYAAAGIKVMLSIPKAPDWARPSNTDRGVEGPAANPQDYANFVAAVAARYKGKVQAIEIWNEQNMDYEWGREPLDPARYMEMLKASYNAIKAVNPDMIVISGAMTPTGAPPPVAMDDVQYLQAMYANGLKNYSDAIGAHPSGFANPPDAKLPEGNLPDKGYDDHRSFFFRETMESYRNIMVQNGDAAKTIWPTEFGWPVLRYDDGRFPFAAENSLETQSQYTVRAYQMMKSWGWVGTAFLWNLDYNITAAGTELSNFGIMGAPVYDALANMPK